MAEMVSVSFRSSILFYNRKYFTVSVFEIKFPSPFGVLFFFIIRNRMCFAYSKTTFPSPFGVLFFFMCIVDKEIENLKCNSFPSPFGVLFFFIRCNE